ncbi:MAG: hypothetical protein UH853_05060, partial [Muribaculaceae bacterium]|nr:hypothetical protein [Muribaculaceae bacterium]
HDGDGEADHEEDKKLEPKDKHAQILGAKDTGYDNDRFDEISKMKAGEVKLITKDNKAGYILVVKGEMKDDPYYEKFYDEIWYPIDSKTHPKAAITKRNQWMVDNADLLIAYVEEGRKGGALTTLKYAEKQGIKIINLAIRDE